MKNISRSHVKFKPEITEAEIEEYCMPNTFYEGMVIGDLKNVDIPDEFSFVSADNTLIPSIQNQINYLTDWCINLAEALTYPENKSSASRLNKEQDTVIYQLKLLKKKLKSGSET